MEAADDCPLAGIVAHTVANWEVGPRTTPARDLQHLHNVERIVTDPFVQVVDKLVAEPTASSVAAVEFDSLVRHQEQNQNEGVEVEDCRAWKDIGHDAALADEDRSDYDRDQDRAYRRNACGGALLRTGHELAPSCTNRCDHELDLFDRCYPLLNSTCYDADLPFFRNVVLDGLPSSNVSTY